MLVSEPLKLIETTGLPYSKYATLSHCWGQGPNLLKTTTQNYTNRLAGIDWNELPPVFQDAISIVREIGCKWMWIDSLCIIQDSPSDWKEESTKMADIYSNSYLNIAATFSSTSYGNFFSDRKRECLADDWDASESGEGEWTMEALELPDESNAGLAVRVSHAQGHGYIRTDRIWGRNYAAPLLGRAWVFQERLLSPRTLHFEASEMIWECNASLMCECGGLSGTKNLKEGLKIKFADAVQDRMPGEEIPDLWQRIVRVYSSLQLTNVSDRPYAHAGIASRIQGKLKSEYLAGIWAADLPRGLLWDSVGPYKAKRLEGCGPTWSWLPFYPVPKGSLACVVYRGDMTTFVQDDRLRIHHEGTFCEYVDGNPFGSVSFGQLDITAAASDAMIQVDMSSDGKRYDHRISVEGIPLTGPTWFNPDCAFFDELWSGTKVLCLYIGVIESNIRALVLKRHISGDYYTRVGVTRFSLVDISSFSWAKVMRVKIL